MSKKKRDRHQKGKTVEQRRCVAVILRLQEERIIRPHLADYIIRCIQEGK